METKRENAIEHQIACSNVEEMGNLTIVETNENLEEPGIKMTNGGDTCSSSESELLLLSNIETRIGCPLKS